MAVPLQISCTVLQSLPDLLIVSYKNPRKQMFQGALLNISNTTPFEGFNDRLKEDNPKDYLQEGFYTVSRRHTYFQQKENEANLNRLGAKKLGVRLRARQVLCNKCKSVCTENGETVQPKRRGGEKENIERQREQLERKPKGRNGRAAAKSPPGVSDLLRKSLVPKIRRLGQNEIERFSSSDVVPKEDEKSKSNPEVELDPLATDPPDLNLRHHPFPLKIKFANLTKIKADSNPQIEYKDPIAVKDLTDQDPPQILDSLQDASGSANSSKHRLPNSECVKPPTLGKRLRKKRGATGSMEDLWDETVSTSAPSTSDFLEPAPPPPLPRQKFESVVEEKQPKRSTPVLKISFGTLGQGTILKIPSKINGPVNQEQDENDENLCSGVSPSVEKSPSSFWANRSPRYTTKESSITAKAAKKALKRAHKEAQRRAKYGGLSPASHVRSSPNTAAISPSTSHFGGCSPLAVSAFSPVRAPLYIGGGSVSPAYPFPSPSDSSAMGRPAQKVKKHKRKKHKKKKTEHTVDPLNNSSPSFCESDEVDPLSISKNFDWKDINPGSVIWGKTNTETWWPAKVTEVSEGVDGSPEVSVVWYCGGNDETKTHSVLNVEKIRSFTEFFQDCVSMCSSDSSFDAAVRLASQELNPDDSAQIEETGSETNPVFSPENSPRTVDCLS